MDQPRFYVAGLIYSIKETRWGSNFNINSERRPMDMESASPVNARLRTLGFRRRLRRGRRRLHHMGWLAYLRAA